MSGHYTIQHLGHDAICPICSGTLKTALIGIDLLCIDCGARFRPFLEGRTDRETIVELYGWSGRPFAEKEGK